MKRIFNLIRPGHFIAAAIIVGSLMVGSAWLELRQSRTELYHLLVEQASSLAETAERSSANIVLATDEVENQMGERLLNNARLIARLDSLGHLDARALGKIARENRLYRINIFDRNGEKIASSHDSTHPDGSRDERMNPAELLRPILDGDVDSMVIGLKEARFEAGHRYAVAVRRSRPEGGAVVVNLNAADFLAFRRRIGIGRLIRDIGNNSGIDYALLQDREGILAAAGAVDTVSSFDRDPGLRTAYDRDTLLMRFLRMGGKESFEVVKRLTIGNATVGILRIGLSTEELRATEARMIRRLIVISIVLGFIGTLLIGAVLAGRNLRTVSREYASVRSSRENILQSMRDAVVSVDREGRVTIFNGAAGDLFGIRPEEIINRTFSDTPGPASDRLGMLFRGGGLEQEIAVTRTDRTVRTVVVSLSDVLSPNGEREGRTAVIKDVTEARRSEAEARRTEKLAAMGSLASSVAHEIRNPLNAISMIAQRLGSEFHPVEGEEEFQGLTRVLKTESARVNSIIAQFLRFARPPAIAPLRVSIPEFFGQMQSLVKSQAQARGIQLQMEYPSAGELLVDPDQMTQALLNLLQNALDATPSGGTVRLIVSREESESRIIITDSGEGIPPEKKERIFDLYYTTKPHGTGMGLPITQQIVAAHHGRILVESVQGEGTTFTILLPRQFPGE